MSTNNQTRKTQEKKREGRAPALIAYHVAERGDNSFWTRIGAAWDHEDARGLTVQLDLIPAMEGRFVLREPTERD